MKIAMVNVTTTIKAGGIETFIWEVSKKLAYLGHEVDIIAGKGRIPCNLPDNLKVIQVPFIPRRLIPNFGTRFRKFIERFSFGLFAFQKIIKKKYTAIHIFKPYDFPLIALVKKITDSKICYGSHGTDFYPFDTLFIKHIDIFFSCSTFNADQIKKRYNITPIVLYNGFDRNTFKPLPVSERLRDALQIKNNEQIILVINRLIGWKGTHHVIEAFKNILSTVKAKLIIIGDGEEKEKNKLKDIADRLQISDFVLFRGYVPNDQLPEYFSISDVYVLASVADETFGITICEAMGCEKPVVSTTVGGIPEVVEDQVTGYLVEPRNPIELSKKIILLLKDRSLRVAMGKKGRETVLTKFTWSKIAEKLLISYEKNPHF